MTNKYNIKDIIRFARNRLTSLPRKYLEMQEQKSINRFHDLYYNGLNNEGPIYLRTQWMNVPCFKCPLDMWVYHQIIVETSPDLVIETGTYKGGSALYMAHVMDAIGKGEIITIDIEDHGPKVPHPRIKYVYGSSSDSDLIHSLLDSRPAEKRMVILDSDHSKKHVLAELNLFWSYVNVGGYIIVEDTNVNGHPTLSSHGEGPFEAVQDFLRRNPNFMADRSREMFLMTFNPGGYLKRIS